MAVGPLAGDQLPDKRLTLPGGNIEGNGLLVAIHRKILGSLAGGVSIGIIGIRRPPMARIVANAGPLYLDDLGSKISKCLCTPRPSQNPGEIKYA